MKTVISSLLTMLIMVLFSCKSGSGDRSHNHQVPDRDDQPASVSDDQQVSSSLKHYISLKDALVASNSSDASAAAGELEKALSQAGNNPELTNIAAEIAATSDLETQREHFKILSEQWIDYLKKSGKSIGVYVQYCPMAFDDAGASWISLSDEVLNPYFGDQMLYCGSVEEQL